MVKMSICQNNKFKIFLKKKRGTAFLLFPKFCRLYRQPALFHNDLTGRGILHDLAFCRQQLTGCLQLQVDLTIGSASE